MSGSSALRPTAAGQSATAGMGGAAVSSSAGRAATARASAGVSASALPASSGSAGKAGATAVSAGSPAAGSSGSGPAAGSGAELAWPNAESSANSDAWLAENHDRISQLRPRVLVIDLESTPETQAKQLVDQHITALAEASSFHKYKDAGQSPALT